MENRNLRIKEAVYLLYENLDLLGKFYSLLSNLTLGVTGVEDKL